jgi:predicted glycoside hydrolase/deacetylase ChbG (UPF0249 family)
MLTINADDWGRSEEITDRILNCYRQRRIHSASAMTFMSDSARAARIALDNQLPVGLHLNFTQDLTGEGVAQNLSRRHRKLIKYLTNRKINQFIYNPMLVGAFRYVFQRQWDEFLRLYAEEPKRIDGHHHMHLCMNMLFSGIIPRGMRVRRNFTFLRGEKTWINRGYRSCVDHWLQSRFSCTDYFMSIQPMHQTKLRRMVLLSRSFDVEIMVHPGVEEEYRFLLSSEWSDIISEASAYHGAA